MGDRERWILVAQLKGLLSYTISKRGASLKASRGLYDETIGIIRSLVELLSAVGTRADVDASDVELHQIHALVMRLRDIDVVVELAPCYQLNRVVHNALVILNRPTRAVGICPLDHEDYIRQSLDCDSIVCPVCETNLYTPLCAPN